MGPYVFYLYRYQLLPISRQPSLLYSLGEILSQKNNFFYEAVQSIENIAIRNKKINYKFELREYNDLEFIPMIASRRKNINVILEDHTESDVDSYPYSYMFIDNNKCQQIIAVQEVSGISPDAIINDFKKIIKNKLSEQGIVIEISPIYQTKEFWDYIKQHERNIIRVSFDLITPNMSNISYMLNEELKETAKTTDTLRTKLILKTDNDKSLTIEKNNKNISDIVDYISGGGGVANIKVRGLRKEYKSDEYQETIEIDEVTVKVDPQYVKDIIREFINNGNNR